MEHIEPASQSGSIEDTAKRLISWSGRKAWGLARVEYVSEFARERVLSTLRYALSERSTPLHEIELPSYRSASDVVRFLVDRLEKIESGVVSISGFATAFNLERSLEDALRVLNFNRENIAPTNLRQIWWMPSSFAQTFVPAVPDLDSWFTFRLYLTEGAPPLRQSRPSDLESPKTPRVNNLPLSEGLFVGRESFLSAIRQGLEKQGTVNVYGVGGSGKTRTALEYAQRHLDHYKAILWMPADSEDSLNIGLLRIAKTLKLAEAQSPDFGRVSEAVLTWLQSSDEWLLILDDVDEKRGIVPSIVSARRGHILVTSRRLVLPSAVPIDVHGLTIVESRELLFNRAKREPTDSDDAGAADELIEMLQHMPLTLELAGAYIENESVDYERYRARLRSLQPASWIFDYESVIASSFEKLEELSKDLLRLCAFFSWYDIPAELVNQSLNVLRSRKQYDAEPKETIRSIRRYDLWRLESKSEAYSMHEIVNVAIRHNHISREVQRDWVELAVNAVLLFLRDDVEGSGLERMLNSALAVAQSIQDWSLTSLNAIALLADVGSYLTSMGQYSKAEALIRHAHRLVSELDEPNNQAEILISNILAMVYHAQGRYEEAKRLYSMVLSLQEKVLGPAAPALTITLNDLAQIEMTGGSYEAAESLLTRALEIQRAIENPDPTALGATLNKLGDVYLAQGRYDKADAASKRAVEVGNFSGDAKIVSQGLSRLGEIYRRQGLLSEAAHIFESLESLSSSSRNDTTYARALMNQANIAAVTGLEDDNVRVESYAKAEALIKMALNALINAGGDNSDIANARRSLAVIYLLEDQYDKAEENMRQALEIQEALLGPGHPDFAASLRIYAQILRATGRSELADEMENRADRISSLQPNRTNEETR